MPFYFYFYFYFYHAFIVSRYKKLRAALAMERTKPINQNKQQKKPNSLPSAATETSLAKNHSAVVPLGNINISTFFNNKNYFSSARFLQGKNFFGNIKANYNTQIHAQKK